MTFKNKILIAIFTVFLSVSLPAMASSQSNFLPSPFPISPMDGKGGSKWTIDVMCTNVKADDMDIDFSGLSVMYTKENPDIGKPSFHYGMFGDISKGKLEDLFNNGDYEFYTLGASITPSFVLTDRYPGFRPLLFLGSTVQYGKMNYDLRYVNFDDLIQILRLTKMLGYTNNPYVFSVLQYPQKKEMIQMGFHTGIYLDFKLNRMSVAPFLMAQAVKSNIEWTYSDGMSVHMDRTTTVYSSGLEFRLRHPDVFILAMAQIIKEHYEADAKAYSVAAGFSF